MPDFLRHLLGYLPTNIAKMVVPFAGVYIFTRLLGPEEYGLYALALTTLHIVHTLTLTWSEASAYRFAGEAEAKNTIPDHLRTCLVLGLMSLVPAMAVLGTILILVSALPGYAETMVWLALIMPFTLIVEMALETHRAGQRVKRYSAIEIGRSLSGFVVGVLLAWQSGLGAASPLVGLAIANAMMVISEFRWMWLRSKGGKIEKDRAKRYFAYGAPIAMALVLDLALSASDRFLIAYFLGEASVGIYAAGYGIADKTVLFLCAWAAMAGSPLIMEAFEKHGRAAASEKAKQMAQTMVLIGLPAAVGIAITADPLADVMIGEALREDAKKIIPWIAFAGFFNGILIHYFSESFHLAHKTARHALLMIVPTVANIVLNIILLPRIGLMGAVYTTLGCYVLAAALLAITGRRYLLMPIPWADLVKVLAACFAMIIVVRVIPDMPALAELIVCASVGAITYAGVVVGLNAAGAREFTSDIISRFQSKLLPHN